MLGAPAADLAALGNPGLRLAQWQECALALEQTPAFRGVSAKPVQQRVGEPRGDRGRNTFQAQHKALSAFNNLKVGKTKLGSASNFQYLCFASHPAQGTGSKFQCLQPVPEY